MRSIVLLCVLFVTTAVGARSSDKAYQKDVKSALDQIEKECKHLLKVKGIKWSKLKSRFAKEAKKVEDDKDQYFLLCRIVAALRDKGSAVEYIVAPDEGHGFRAPENRMALAASMEKFLAKHLGGRYQEEVPPAIAQRLEEITVDVSGVRAPEEMMTEAAAGGGS